MKFKADQLKMYWYWMQERHAIWKKRAAKQEHPWTTDPILGEYKFTNVYRQLDRVTLEWQDRYAHLLARSKKIKNELKNSDIVFHCIMFRLFNLPETYDALYFGMRKWDKKQAIKILLKRQKEDFEQIFTGAYIITGGKEGVPKIETICDAVDFVWRRRRQFANLIRKSGSMEKTVEILQRIPTVGGFVGYEIACDLRFTKVLAHATDTLSWANPGPGAVRGISRLLTGKAQKTAGVDYHEGMRWLLTHMPAKLREHLKHPEWPIEMREIEHSLCEFDKYMRVKNKEGKPRSRYRPPRPQVEMRFGDEEE